MYSTQKLIAQLQLVDKPRKQMIGKFRMVPEKAILSQFILLIFILDYSVCNPLLGTQRSSSTVSSIVEHNSTSGNITNLLKSTPRRSQLEEFNDSGNPSAIKNNVAISNNKTLGRPSERSISRSHLVDTSKQQPATVENAKKKSRKLKNETSILFREEVENYPEDEIKLLLKQTSDELKELFNVINTPLDPNMNLTERTASRYDEESIGEGREESVCKSVLKKISPRQLEKDNSLVYVANTQDFMQIIEAEICKYPNQECSFLQDNLPYGMTSTCQQKYAYKKLLYLHPLEKRMAADLFRYPSCCSCHVIHSSIDSRIGLNSSKLVAPKPSINQPVSETSNSSQLPPTKFKDAAGTIYEDSKEESDQAISNSAKTTPAVEKEVYHQPKRSGKALNLSAIIDNVPMRFNVSKSKDSKFITIDDDMVISTNISTTIVESKALTNIVRDAKRINSTHHTVVLQEDKVYKPISEN